MNIPGFHEKLPDFHEGIAGDGDTIAEKSRPGYRHREVMRELTGGGPRRMNDTEMREVDRLRARLAMMSEVSRRITQSWDLSTVLQEVVDGARSLTDARYGAVGVFDDSGRIREFITSGISTEQRDCWGNRPRAWASSATSTRSRGLCDLRTSPSTPIRSAFPRTIRR